MKFPLRIVIHVAQRKTIDFRPALIGLHCALIVDQGLPFFGYDLEAPIRPTKPRAHVLVTRIADHIRAGYAVAVWDLDRLLSDLSTIVVSTVATRPRLKDAIETDWKVISDADDETLIDLKGFSRLPNGHYLALVAARDREMVLPVRVRRTRITNQRPRSEELWTVLMGIIFERREVDMAMSAYKGWVGGGRPKPPKAEAYLPINSA